MVEAQNTKNFTNVYVFLSINPKRYPLYMCETHFSISPLREGKWRGRCLICFNHRFIFSTRMQTRQVSIDVRAGSTWTVFEIERNFSTTTYSIGTRSPPQNMRYVYEVFLLGILHLIGEGKNWNYANYGLIILESARKTSKIFAFTDTSSIRLDSFVWVIKDHLEIIIMSLITLEWFG